MDITTNPAPGQRGDIRTSAILIRIPKGFRDSYVPFFCFVDEEEKFLGALSFASDEITILGGRGITFDPDHFLDSVASCLKFSLDTVQIMGANFGAQGTARVVFCPDGPAGGALGGVTSRGQRRVWDEADIDGPVHAKSLYGDQQAIVPAASVTIDPTKGEAVFIPLATATPIGTFSIANGMPNQTITIAILQDGNGGCPFPATWGNCALAAGAFTVTATAGKGTTATLKFFTGMGWVQIAGTANL